MRRLLLFTLLCTLSTAGAAPAAEPAGAAGTWEGAIALPNGAELGIAVTLQPGDEGWSGTIDIPAQGLAGYELSNVSVAGGRVRFAMASIPGEPAFDGELADTGEAIAGTFRQGGAELGFSLRRTGGDGETGEAGPPGPPDAGQAPPAAAPAAPGVPGEGAVGEWMGALVVGPTRLRLVFTVEAADDGTLRASVDSVDQGAQIPVGSVAVDGRAWRLELPAIGASFTGTMNEDGSAVDGTWTQGGQSLPLRLVRLAEPFALRRPQHPEPPFPYESRDVTFANRRAGLRLAGTLAIPPGDGPFPAVVLVSGSGPQDRDESLMGHKPFLVIADQLARRGIASLRYDDRGTGASGGDHLSSTVADFAADAEAALAFLAARPEVDRDALGIVGHSEGGLTGPRVAAGNREVDFLVLLAPPGVPMGDLLGRQMRDVLQQRGVDQALIERALAMQGADLATLADESLSADEAAARLREAARRRLEQLTAAERTALLYDEAAIERGIEQGASPWFRSLMREDPATHLAKIRIPVLALFAGKDIQVAPEVNAERVERSLAAAGNEDFEVRILPGLNHLFQHATTGAISEYGEIEETFAPQALELIGDWILERFAEPRPAPAG